jgi:WD40 repeat protein
MWKRDPLGRLAATLMVLMATLAVMACNRSSRPAIEPEAETPAPAEGSDLYGDPLPEGAVARIGTLKPEEKARPHPPGPQSLIFLKDGKTLATLSTHGGPPEVLFWNPATGRLQDTFRPRDVVDSWKWSSVRLSPDAGTVAAMGYDKADDPNHWHGSYIWLWERKTGKAIHKLWMPTDIDGPIAFSPNGRLVAAGESDGRVRVWTVSEGKKLSDWDLMPGVVRRPRTPSDRKEILYYRVSPIIFSPDSKTMAVLGGSSTMYLCDPHTGKRLRSWDVTKNDEDDGAVRSLAFSNDWKRLACGTAHGKILWWDVETEKLLRRSELPVQGKDFQGKPYRPSVYTVAFSPDGKMLVSGDGANVVRLWDVETGKEIAKLEGHKKDVTKVAFSPDGKTLVSLSWDLTALVWKAPPMKR